MAHDLIVTGTRACFARPEFFDDRISYDVITPIAARGIFESIHWTPAIRWHIESIIVLNPIRTEWIEDRSGAPGGRARSHVLVDVAYRLRARFELTADAGPRDNAAQHSAMFKRRAQGQRFFRAPYLGRPGLSAAVVLADPSAPARSHFDGSGTIDLGWMTFDLDPARPGTIRYYRPLMQDGVIDLTALDPMMLPG